MKRTGTTRWPVVLLASLLVTFATSCKESNSGTGLGNGNGNGTPSEISQAAGSINGVVATFFVPNEANFAALDLISQSFGAAFAPPAAGARLEQPLRAVQPSCFQAPGTTYEFDPEGDTYVASMRTGAPADGVRFIVYELDTGGHPVVPLVETGYVDLVCTSETLGTYALSLDLVIGGVTVFSISTPAATISPTSASAEFSVTLRNPSGTQQLSGGASVLRDASSETLGLSVDVQTDLVAVFEITSNASGDGNVHSSIVGGAEDVDFFIDLHVDFDEMGNLVGTITFDDLTTFNLIACVSGTTDAALISDATTGGCTFEGAVPVSLSAADLFAITAAFQGLGDAHDTLGTIINRTIEAILAFLGP